MLYDWTLAESYVAQKAKLRRHPATITADKFVGMNGHAPHLWLTPGVHTILARAAEPCPPGRIWSLRLGVMRYIQKQIWRDRFLGGYVGKLRGGELLVERVDVRLIIDDGEPFMLRLVVVLLESEMLLAEANEFDLGADYWAERAIIRALFLEPR
jgi:hypothetical protein